MTSDLQAARDRVLTVAETFNGADAGDLLSELDAALDALIAVSQRESACRWQQEDPNEPDCFNGFFHPDCLIKHETEIHIGPRERAVLAQWREQAAQR